MGDFLWPRRVVPYNAYEVNNVLFFLGGGGGGVKKIAPLRICFIVGIDFIYWFAHDFIPATGTLNFPCTESYLDP